MYLNTYEYEYEYILPGPDTHTPTHTSSLPDSGLTLMAVSGFLFGDSRPTSSGSVTQQTH